MPSVSGWVRIPVVRRSPGPSGAVGVVLEYQPPGARSGWVRYLGRTGEVERPPSMSQVTHGHPEITKESGKNLYESWCMDIHGPRTRPPETLKTGHRYV